MEQNTEHRCFRLLVGAQAPRSEYSLSSETLRSVLGELTKLGNDTRLSTIHWRDT